MFWFLLLLQFHLYVSHVYQLNLINSSCVIHLMMLGVVHFIYCGDIDMFC